MAMSRRLGGVAALAAALLVLFSGGAAAALPALGAGEPGADSDLYSPLSLAAWEMNLWEPAGPEGPSAMAQPALPAPFPPIPVPVPPPEAVASWHQDPPGSGFEAGQLALDFLRRAQAAEAGPAAALAATLPRSGPPVAAVEVPPAGSLPSWNLTAELYFSQNDTTVGMFGRRPGHLGGAPERGSFAIQAGWARTRRYVFLPGNRVVEASEVQLHITISSAALICFALAGVCLALYRYLLGEEGEEGEQEEGASEAQQGDEPGPDSSAAFIMSAGYAKL